MPLLSAEIDKILVEHTNFQDVLTQVQFVVETASHRAVRRPCIPVIGHSGAGKTTVIDNIRAEFPIVENGREVRLPDGATAMCDHVPVLCVEMPSKVAVGRIARLILRTLGDPRWNKGKTDDLDYRVDTLLRACGTVCVLVDEAQRVVDRAGVLTAEGVIDWFKERHAANPIAFLMFGMPRMRMLFDQDSQFKRRWDSEIDLAPYDWGEDEDNDVSDRLNFMGLLAAFRNECPIMFADEVDVEDDDVAKRFYYASRGLAGGLHKLFEMTCRIVDERAWRARRVGEAPAPAVIDMGLLEAAYDRAFRPRTSHERLINPFSRTEWDGRLPPPLPDDNTVTHEAKRRRRMARTSTGRPSTRSERKRAVDAALSKR